MAEKKGIWKSLFGGGCSCGMDIAEDDTDSKKSTKRGCCCDMQIVEANDENDETAVKEPEH